MGFLPFPGESQLRQSRATQHTVHAGRFSVSIIIRRILDIDYSIFNVRTDVNACDCTRGCTDTPRESALTVDSRRKISGRTGISYLNPVNHKGLYQDYTTLWGKEEEKKKFSLFGEMVVVA